MKRTALLCITLLLASPATAQGFLYVQSLGDTLTVVPADSVVSYVQSPDEVRLMLSTGKTLVIPGAERVLSTSPVELPRFSSYRFNSKRNDQLFTSAAASAEELLRDTVRISIGQIGKYLTATFLLSDSGACAWVGTRLQESRVTRQRMSDPVTYTIGRPAWRRLDFVRDEDGMLSYAYVPWGRETTVCVDFLTDHPAISYNVPRISITTSTGAVPLSKAYYIDATISIEGGGVYPDMPSTAILIKGRGNSSWRASANSKNSYHLKFSEKQMPLGMTAGKHWVLLGNKQAGSMLCNALEQKAAALAGCVAPCHIVPVELYINGAYRGSYNLTEKVGLNNNSVSLPDASRAAMLELDTYTDEPIWKSNAYSLSTKIHDPDFDDENPFLAISSADVIADWDAATQVLRTGSAEQYIGRFDLNSLVSYLMLNELCYNSELQHPKSVFLYSADVTDEGFRLTGQDETPWMFGPVWDCDWSFGYQMGSDTYFVNRAEAAYYDGWLQSQVGGFWYDLRYKSQAVDEAYFTLWHRFVTDGRLQELIDYVQDYYDYASPSLTHNASNVTSEKDGVSYLVSTRRAATWFRRHAQYVLSRLRAYDIPEEQPVGQPVPIILDTPDGMGLQIADSNSSDSKQYDLSGRQLPAGQPRRGIIITQGGRKILAP